MRMMETIKSGGVYLIAEMSANHGGRLEDALKIVRMAAKAGADCIKIQTYTADTMTIPCDNEYFRIQSGLWQGRTLYDLYTEAATPWEWHAPIRDECAKQGVNFLSTPFDTSAVDFLESLGVGAYKVASFELADLPLVRYVAAKGKPLVLSCGMAAEEEIEEAIAAARSQGCQDIVLLKCTSEYPARFENMHLNAIPAMMRRFGVPVGLSDHSTGGAAAVAAVALGACVVEKHVCLSRGMDTPDSAFSMEPEEFAQMAKDIRRAKQALGEAKMGMNEGEQDSRIFRRSVFAVRDIAQGDIFTEENIRVIRPGYGLPPKYFEALQGVYAGAPVQRGEPLDFSHIKGAVLFLTNGEAALPLYRQFMMRENVFLYGEKLTVDFIRAVQPAFVVSCNYQYIIPGEVLRLISPRAVNLHISLLPWNRGASPNFFSFYEDTPKGVSVHLLDEGIDTGNILCQKEVLLDAGEHTFETAYQKLHAEMQALFLKNWEDIRQGAITPRNQTEEGSFHTKAELAALYRRYPFEWGENIADVMRILKGAP
jgi:pseudaminic acid synthase